MIRSVLRSFLLPLRAEPMIRIKIKAARPIVPMRKNLECRMLPRLNLDLLLVGLMGLELSAI